MHGIGGLGVREPLTWVRPARRHWTGDLLTGYFDYINICRPEAPMTITPSARDLSRVDTLQVVVRENTPFLPKVAFTLITIASMAGVTLTSTGMGLSWSQTGMRWLTLWSTALAGGFLVWRTVYVRGREPGTDDAAVAALNDTAFDIADRVSRWVAVVLVLGAPGALVVPTVTGAGWVSGLLVAGSLLVAALMAVGVRRAPVAAAAALVVAALLVGWAWLDAGNGWPFWIRLLHLTAFTLWLGGALWNIGVAMPAGRQHPVVPAVLAGARQLDRFRWVVRFALPTIIVTGLVMAGAYRSLPIQWWLTFPGVLIPLKVMSILALVVVFITCPLFRHCSPVQGVCDIEDLHLDDDVAAAHVPTAVDTGALGAAQVDPGRALPAPADGVTPGGGVVPQVAGAGRGAATGTSPGASGPATGS
ncbi:hypothetical protein [Ornithinimicrobium avium]|uniref:hypothetical protein n=1 Tax=Ornithinimicrobium avium TaxID=2283195 RepID=UPI00192D4FAD|nr:hypothetical protein [Ornithinimicrobium avium]